MKEKIIQKSNPSYTELINYIKNRCLEEKVNITNNISLVFNKHKTLISFKLHNKEYSKERKETIISYTDIPIFKKESICPKCKNYNNSNVLVIEKDSGQDFEHNYKDCRYCLSNLHSFLQTRGIKTYQIKENAFKKKTWVPTKDSYYPQTLFSKANEHYISASELSKNPLTVEQATINYSECLEKILKGIAEVHKIKTPKIHNLEEIYFTVKRTNPDTFSFNLKLLKELSYAYKLLRYKEQNLKCNEIIRINITYIKQEVDFIVSNLSDYLKYDKEYDESFYRINPWYHSWNNHNQYSRLNNIFNRLSRKSNPYLIKETSYFQDVKSSQHYYIDKYILSSMHNNSFILKSSNNSLSYNSFLHDNQGNKLIKAIINGSEYIPKTK